jgi:hypothetical protein
MFISTPPGKIPNSRDAAFEKKHNFSVSGINLKGSMKVSPTIGTVFVYLTELKGLVKPTSHGPFRDIPDAIAYLEKRAQCKVELREGAEIASGLSPQDEALLESLRTEPKTSDRMYGNACFRLGQKPKPRPNFNAGNTAPVATTPVNPYAPAVQRRIFQALFLDMAVSNPNVSAGGRADLRELNQQKMQLWLRDEGYSLPDSGEGMTAGKTVDVADLTRCVNELFYCGMLHNESAGKRGFKAEIRPYSRDRISAYRQTHAAPAPLETIVLTRAQAELMKHKNAQAANKDLYKKAFSQVWSQHPTLDHESGEFKKLVDDLIKKWAAPKPRSSLVMLD